MEVKSGTFVVFLIPGIFAGFFVDTGNGLLFSDDFSSLPGDSSFIEGFSLLLTDGSFASSLGFRLFFLLHQRMKLINLQRKVNGPASLMPILHEVAGFYFLYSTNRTGW